MDQYANQNQMSGSPTGTQVPTPSEGKRGKKGDLPVGPDVSLLAQDIANMSRRVRMLEERSINLRNKLGMADNSLIEFKKKINLETKTVISDVNDMKRELVNLSEKLGQIVKELQNKARSNDVKLIEKYLSYWQPMKYMTEADVRSIVKKMLNDQLD